MTNKKIYVTQPALPPLEEFGDYLKQIWDNKILTNNGPFHQELEKRLAEYLGVKYISLFCNGTIALLTALQTLGVKGEVITTPFSFVATAHSLLWNNLTPVFVDIDPLTYNLDPSKIEKAITKNTSAIMPVHVYGTPCDVNAVQKIADKHNLKVIYDAAHAFGVKINGDSVLNYGDLSVLSFHATKTYNTIEGGAIICHDKETKEKIDKLKNFGFVDETTVIEAGINGKMNEIQAAFGLMYLDHVDEYIAKRKKVVENYTASLKDIDGISMLDVNSEVTSNYSYFPIVIDRDAFGISRDNLYDLLKTHNIFARRYFYPLISSFDMYKGFDSAKLSNLSIANAVADKVLCLPLFPELSPEDQNKIIKIIIDRK